MATQHQTAHGVPENQPVMGMGQMQQPHCDRYGSHLLPPLLPPLQSFNAPVRQGHHHVAATPYLLSPPLEHQRPWGLHGLHDHSLLHITRPVPTSVGQPALFCQTWRPPPIYSRIPTRSPGRQAYPTPGILANRSRAPSVDLRPGLRRTPRLWAPPQVSGSGDIGVAGSVADNRGPATGAKYSLSMRQQPVAARSCGSGERDRRTIDPPPILQLRIEGPGLAEEESSKLLRYSEYVMSCSICDQSGTQDLSFMPEEYRQRRRLMGSVVSTSFVGQDEYGETGCFFCFPDLSCRTPGSFRLKFGLVEVDLAQARQTKHFPILAEAMSDIFVVYLAKDFPGMQASTPLAKHLKEQGCVITIKKGFRESNSDSDQDDSANEEQEVEWSPTRKRRRLGNGRVG